MYRPDLCDSTIVHPSIIRVRFLGILQSSDRCGRVFHLTNRARVSNSRPPGAGLLIYISKVELLIGVIIYMSSVKSDGRRSMVSRSTAAADSVQPRAWKRALARSPRSRVSSRIQSDRSVDRSVGRRRERGEPKALRWRESEFGATVYWLCGARVEENSVVLLLWRKTVTKILNRRGAVGCNVQDEAYTSGNFEFVCFFGCGVVIQLSGVDSYLGLRVDRWAWSNYCV